MQGLAVEVTYEQTSEYKTTDSRGQGAFHIRNGSSSLPRHAPRSTVNISKLLARKSRQAERKITILREVETSGSIHGSDADNDGYRHGDSTIVVMVLLRVSKNEGIA